jgi:acyl-CoA synthetase (AMP-forming)/AMP-acid ligase II
MAGNDTFLRLLAGARFWDTIDLGALHTVIDHGEPPRQTTIRDFEARFECAGAVRPGYGLVETVGAVAVLAGSGTLAIDRNGVVASGRPLPGISVAIAGKDGNERSAGEIGEITVSGEAVFEAYFDDRALTSERLRDGWFHTGDLGYFDDDGNLFVLGRDHEIIRHRERSLLPRQVEEAAAAVDDVESLAAIGRPPKDAGTVGHQTLVVVAEVSRTAREDRDQMKQISDEVNAAVKSTLRVAPDEVLLVKKGVVPRTDDGRTAYGRMREKVVSGELARDGSILYGGKVFISPLKR